MAVGQPEKNIWDHYPSDEELATLVIDPADNRDQHGNLYTPLVWSKGSRIAMICTVCEKDFTEGGWFNFAPQGRGRGAMPVLFRILVCPEHTMIRALLDEDDQVCAL